MLTHLHIRNLAVVDDAELEFDAGLTVLTGETGAGKSILLDALCLAAGERADSKAVRSSAKQLEVSATFDLDAQPATQAWLDEHDLADDGHCLLRRIVTAEGRSRGYVNGHAVPMQTLRELGEQLFDICGQQAHQSLRHPGVQRQLLDGYGQCRTHLERVAKLHADWLASHERLTMLRENRDELEHRRELLGYQVTELEALSPEPGEAGELERQADLAANALRIAETSARAIDGLYDADEGSARDIVGIARAQLEGLAEVDTQLQPAVELLREAEIQISEAAEALRQRLDGLDHDPEQQQRIEQRLATMQELARKHRTTPAELPDLIEHLRDELESLADGADIDALAAQTEARYKALRSAAAKLSAARRKAAGRLGEAVTQSIQGLGMAAGEFSVAVEPLDGEIRADGADRIELRIAANPGQAPGPLSRVASGGELSRISLAVQVAAQAGGTIPTMIFDEVDAGVGGSTAEMVGDQLKALSAQRQVICVTHLPQVASKGDHHLRVSKTATGNTTQTEVVPLSDAARIEEIARMLGGVKITGRTRDHAAEMLGLTPEREAG